MKVEGSKLSPVTGGRIPGFFTSLPIHEKSINATGAVDTARITSHVLGGSPSYSPNLSGKMRRTGLLQLGLLCFVLASDITEWRWFDDMASPRSAPAAQSQIDAFPFALRFKQQILEEIAVPPTLCCGLHCEFPALHETGSFPVPDAHPGSYPGVALAYAHMSIQR